MGLVTCDPRQVFRVAYNPQIVLLPSSGLGSVSCVPFQTSNSVFKFFSILIFLQICKYFVFA